MDSVLPCLLVQTKHLSFIQFKDVKNTNMHLDTYKNKLKSLGTFHPSKMFSSSHLKFKSSLSK